MAVNSKSQKKEEDMAVNSKSQKREKGMASNSKGQSKERDMAPRGKGQREDENTDVREDEDKISSLKIELIFTIIAVVSLLMILGFFGIGGVVGRFFGKITGVFGIMGYIFPFALFIGVVFAAVNMGKAGAKRRLYGSIGLYVAFCALLQLVIYGGGTGIKTGAYILQGWKNKSGGGIVGGLIVKLFSSFLGTAGTYVILIALILVLLMMVTEKFLFAFLGRKGKQQYEVFVERQEERKQQRIKKKAVTFNLVDPASSKKGENIEKSGGADRVNENTKGEIKEEKEKKDDDLEYFPINRGKSGFGDKKASPVYKQELESKFKGTKERIFQEKTGEDEKEEVLPSSLDLDFEALDKLVGQRADELSQDILREEKGFLDIFAGESGDGKGYGDREAVQTGTAKAGVEDVIAADAAGGEARGYNVSEAEKGEGVNTELGSREPVKPEPVNSELMGRKPVGREADSTKPISNKLVDNEKVNKEAVKPEQVKKEKPYRFPPIDLLKKSKGSEGNSDEVLRETARKLKSTLESFGVKTTVTNVSCGPTVTRYEIQPEQGVKVSRITGLTDDIKLNLAASEIRIEAPIPGKAAVGIEIPNKEIEPVCLRDLLESPEFTKSKSKVTFAVGKDIGNQTIVTDIAKMPHVLIAGATGAGKSVCINTLIMSLIYKADPKDVKLILIDPKVVELSIYNDIPHLLVPVVTDCKKALGALNWAVTEMTERYQKFSDLSVRDLEGYNKKLDKDEYKDKGYSKMPQIVVIVDEMADLMMVAQGDVEGAIVRLTQLARAAGIHLVIATQRPSVNVITGLIKANIPSRIAFSVSSQVDSRTILDSAGAEHLLGKGDMLFAPRDLPKPIRVQGAFVSDEEVNAVVEFLRAQNEDHSYDLSISEKIEASVLTENDNKQQEADEDNGRDSYFEEAGRLIIMKNKASIGLLQRALKIGFNRAARIMDQLCELGVVGEEQGTKPREILMSLESFEDMLNK